MFLNFQCVEALFIADSYPFRASTGQPGPHPPITRGGENTAYIPFPMAQLIHLQAYRPF
jgi:hypothetical protein